MQQRVADGSVGASTMRNMGPAGTILAVRRFLCDPTILRAFASLNSRDAFEKLLDEQTEELKKILPPGRRERKGKYLGDWGERWGVARKCLNIFIYECVLNRPLCEGYIGLAELQPWLEVPLDSYVGRGLNRKDLLKDLPAWESVISLSKSQNSVYQEFASKLAATESIARVHLDLEFYTERSEG
jgi:hypothetical protein